MVQVGHACLEAGAAFAVPCSCRLVLLAVPDQRALRQVLDDYREREIRFCAFTESDPAEELGNEPMGITAACTEPICGARRKRFRRFRLWRETSLQARETS